MEGQREEPGRSCFEKEGYSEGSPQPTEPWGEEVVWGGPREEEVEADSENHSLDKCSLRRWESRTAAKGGGWQGCKILRAMCLFFQGQRGPSVFGHRGSWRRGRNGSGWEQY